MCVTVQITLPQHNTGLINVSLSLVLLFRWTCLGCICKILLKSSYVTRCIVAMVHSNRILKDALLHISNEVRGEAASVINRVPNSEHVLRGSTTPRILKVSAHHTERNGNEENRPKFSDVPVINMIIICNYKEFGHQVPPQTERDDAVHTCWRKTGRHSW
jgi:hypothetical protein